MNNKTRDQLLAAFRDGAPYRWVWHFQTIDGHATTICRANMGYHEAKSRAEHRNEIGIGYQYIPDKKTPEKVSLVFPKSWQVNYAVRCDDDGNPKLFHRVFRKGIPLLTFVEDLTGQFPKSLTNIRVTDVKIGCIN